MSASPRLGAMASPPRRAHSDGFTGRRESYVGPEGSGPSACAAAHQCCDDADTLKHNLVIIFVSLRALHIWQDGDSMAKQLECLVCNA